jgi:hypothetical protein
MPFRLVLPSLLFLLLISGCRNDPPADSAAARKSDSMANSGSTPTPGESLPGPDSSAAGNAITGRSRTPAPASVQTALVDSVRMFVDAVASNRSERFWEMLSARSREAVGTQSGGTREQVWDAARETLGSLKSPSVRFVGGTVDSVSLMIGRKSTEVIDSLNNEVETFDDPVIIHFLRENGRWKAIYPGLLYPERDLR